MGTHASVRAVTLVGSRAEGRATELSDIDLLVETDDFERLRDELPRLVEELGRLPERQRLALVQRELCGRSHADLADQLATTVSATKSLIIRARTQLRTAHAA